MEPINVSTLQLCIDNLDSIVVAVRRVDMSYDDDSTITFKRDSENAWYLDPDTD